MLRRRELLLAACCSAYALIHNFAVATETNSRWLCSTIDPGPSDKLLTTEGLPRVNYGTLDEADLWTIQDGLTPGTGVITLGIAFLGGTEEQKAIVRANAPLWLDGQVYDGVETSLRGKIALKFDAPLESASIRVAFSAEGGNRSLIGRQALRKAKNLETMNLQNAEPKVVLHEFGHALGLAHEHLNPQSTIEWKEDAVYEAFKPLLQNALPEGWKIEDYIKSQVIDRYTSPAMQCRGSGDFDPKSIMLYRVDPAWTKNNQEFPENSVISPGDYKCLANAYRRVDP